MFWFGWHIFQIAVTGRMNIREKLHVPIIASKYEGQIMEFKQKNALNSRTVLVVFLYIFGVHSLWLCIFHRELGKQHREEEEQQRALVLEGHELYKEYCFKGKEAKREKQVGVTDDQTGKNNKICKV